MKDARVTYRRRHCYNTATNRVKKVHTPGGGLAVHYRRKSAKAPRCGDCGVTLPGLARVRPSENKRQTATARTVARAYGGSQCATCTRSRILRAFIIEEQKIVKKVLLEKMKKKESK